ncbi:MAG: lipid-A-disaccharide synthase N-terminal domain-containing protein [Phycisphaerales bacterium]
MKPGPVIAMVGLLVAGMALVLQPTLARGGYDFRVEVGTTEFLVKQAQDGYQIVAPSRHASEQVIPPDAFGDLVLREQHLWQDRPAFERTLLGFFNISSWSNFAWVVVGLLGQGAFFGRMFIQWVVSEKRRQSQVPELFWWLSFAGGICLFTYFVWRVDVVGVLGQSTGVVIYARNLRLIQKQKRRDRRAAESSVARGPDQEGDDAGLA